MRISTMDLGSLFSSALPSSSVFTSGFFWRTGTGMMISERWTILLNQSVNKRQPQNFRYIMPKLESQNWSDLRKEKKSISNNRPFLLRLLIWSKLCESDSISFYASLSSLLTPFSIRFLVFTDRITQTPAVLTSIHCLIAVAANPFVELVWNDSSRQDLNPAVDIIALECIFLN